ncbi:helix-turn-helix domain-containing protein [Porphyromonas gulae]|uniref:XRE family transcriptional regulator n=1 Tax=Porphyromonas gulae TaxID=111105 RepID=A0A0A2FP20_9PORP|nr:helix-turn-helix transcriptional regulator [Porphyromonas gulae]KGN92773.1 XRE family transcriptional regulator [Porphyromonas gulae]
MQNVGLRLKQERNRKGYSLQYVAASLNVSTTTVYRIETGNKYLSMELFDRYCELLGLNPRDVFSNPAMEERDRIALEIGRRVIEIMELGVTIILPKIMNINIRPGPPDSKMKQ